jgi:hypothetical protein
MHSLELIVVTKNAESKSKLQGSDHHHSLEVSEMTQSMIAKDDLLVLDLEKKDMEMAVSKIRSND